MKNILFVLLLMMISLIGYSQNANVKLENGVYKSIKTTKPKEIPVLLAIKYVDSEGKSHNVYKNPSTGKIFVLKKSKKTGKEYKYYLVTESKI